VRMHIRSTRNIRNI